MTETEYTPPQHFPNEHSYLRYALDGLRRTSDAFDDIGRDIRQTNRVANFTHVIRRFYQEKTRPFATGEEVERFILALAADLDVGDLAVSGAPQSPADHGNQVPDTAKATFHAFCGKLLPKLNDASDPQETGAFIIYEMGLRGQFFAKDNHIISQALQAFALMRHGARLPIYRENQEALDEFMHNVGTHEDYEGWLKFYRSQFQQFPRIEGQAAEQPADKWHVKSTNMFDPHNTIFQPEHALRNATVMARLNFVTGQYPQEIAVFRPSRMLLHETIAALVTRVQLPRIKSNIKEFLEENASYQELQRQIKPLDPEFDKMAQRFEEYTRYILDDHFHMVSPHHATRTMLGEEKAVIEKRIVSGKYEPRTVESRQALRVLMSDRFLKEFYQSKIRAAVDGIVTEYLRKHPEQALPLWPNPDRFAWVTAGGPAAGKSSLKGKIDGERLYTGETAPLCYVNPDEFREFLLERSGDPAVDALHSSRTHGEASRITDIILERLDKIW